MEFSEKQKEAITHVAGPMVVVAGPGSGKTTVLTHRVKFLLEKEGVAPEKILVITFTKAAANEMQHRFERLYGRKIPVTFGTFHSVFFRILRQAYNYSVDNIVREDVKQHMLLDAVIKSRMEWENSQEELALLAGEIGRVKAEGIDIHAYHSLKYPTEDFRRIYQYYEAALRRERLLDFDDMLIMCEKLLSSREDILKLWQDRFEYILIDEFQDINQVQYEVIRKLALPTNNLYIVGDDDQSIYGFRGSKPKIMLQFDKDYPQTKRVVLDENYRSSASIVAAANQVISHNKERFPKEIHTSNEKGEAVDIVEFPDIKAEYDRVIKVIREGVATGVSYQDYAILFRTNSIAEPLVRQFLSYNIPFVIKDGIPNLFEHWVAKDLIAYLAFATGHRERANFLRIMNKPLRYIGRDYLTDSVIDLMELEKYYEEKPWMMERIAKLASDMRLMKDMTPFAAITFVRRGIGYDEYIKSYATEHGIDVQDLMGVADEVLESTKNYATVKDWMDYIKDYAVSYAECNRNRFRDNDGNVVTMTTMHSAKGLEYTEVFLIDANEEITPHKKSISDEELEEERRMFYVAMTRAKKRLHIYYPQARYNRKLQASRFVEEIMEPYSTVGVNTK